MKAFIFSGFNPRAVVAVCRKLKEYGLQASIISLRDEDEILKGPYRKWVVQRFEKASLTIEFILNSVQKWRDEDEDIFLFPTTEFLNRILIANEIKLKSQGIRVGLPRKSVYEQLSDKQAFLRLCQKHGLSVPKEWGQWSDAEVPCVIKPKKYVSSGGQIEKPFLVFSRFSGQQYLLSRDSNDYILQQYISGESFYLLLHRSRLGSVRYGGQKNLLQQTQGGSILRAVSVNFSEKQVVSRICNLLSDIDFFGLCMIEFRVQGQKWFVIEANPRPWGPLQLTIDSGMGLVDSFLLDNHLIGKVVESEFLPGVGYEWAGGFGNDDVRLAELPTNFEKEVVEIYQKRTIDE